MQGFHTQIPFWFIPSICFTMKMLSQLSLAGIDKCYPFHLFCNNLCWFYCGPGSVHADDLATYHLETFSEVSETHRQVTYRVEKVLSSHTKKGKIMKLASRNSKVFIEWSVDLTTKDQRDFQVANMISG